MIKISSYLIACRFTAWKELLKRHEDLVSVRAGIKAGLELIDQAMALGVEGIQLLRRPSVEAPRRSDDRRTKSTPRSVEEVSFRTIVEKFVAEHNFVLVPTNRSDPDTGARIFRIAENVSGRGGLDAYIASDILWVQDRNDVAFNPTLLDELPSKMRS